MILVHEGGVEILVNMAQVTCVTPYKAGSRLHFDDLSYKIVDETIDEILELCGYNIKVEPSAKKK